MTTSTLIMAAAAHFNTVLHGSSVEVVRGIQSKSAGFVLTNPPFINRYTAWHGRAIRSDKFQ